MQSAIKSRVVNERSHLPSKCSRSKRTEQELGLKLLRFLFVCVGAVRRDVIAELLFVVRFGNFGCFGVLIFSFEFQANSRFKVFVMCFKN
jgi:hypothetical protein